MKREPDDRSHSRENMLGIALVALVGGIMLFFLYVISLGIVGNVLAGGCIVGMVLAIHYLLWGRALSAEVASERDAIQRQEMSETQGKTTPPPNAIQDLTRTHGIKNRQTLDR